MPQISLYIDEKTLKKIEAAATREHLSLSKWVAQQLRSKVDPAYPTGFDAVFGSITDDSFKAVPHLSFAEDSHRETL